MRHIKTEDREVTIGYHLFRGKQPCGICQKNPALVTGFFIKSITNEQHLYADSDGPAAKVVSGKIQPFLDPEKKMCLSCLDQQIEIANAHFDTDRQ